MLSYRKLAMRVLGRPLHTGGGNDSPRPASQRAAAFILTAAMLTTLAAPAFADIWHIENGDITISAGESGNNVTQNENTTENDPDTIITNREEGASSHTVTIDAKDKDDKVEVTLKDVNIDASSRSEAAVSVTGKGDTTIELDGDNELKSGAGHAGLEHNKTDTSGKLTIQDKDKNGSLDATGGFRGAGIGGGEAQNGQVTITGGTITATAGSSSGRFIYGGGSGIGGGDGGTGVGGNGDVEITGGTITATGFYGAGIGGGRSADGDVTISGGNITATGYGTGAGIGSYDDNSSNITITGGTITATGNDKAPAIGNGSVSISNADAPLDITATAPVANKAIQSSDGKTLDDVIRLKENDTLGLVTLVESGTYSISRLFHNGFYAANVPSFHSPNRVEAEMSEAEKAQYGDISSVHNWKVSNREDPTCGKDGYIDYICMVGKCGATFRHTLPATGQHTWNEGVVTRKPTCTEKGVRTFTCSVCHNIRTEDIPTTGEHQWKLLSTTAATCGQDGTVTYQCEVCNETKTETLNATGQHSYGAGVVTKAATCAEPGIMTYTCVVCNDSYTESIPVDKSTHKWDAGVVTKEPTCTADGVRTFTCSVCGDTRTEAIKALGHEYGEWVIDRDATCVEEGSKHRDCIRGDATQTEAIPVSKTHTFGEWVITKEPTCTEKGERQRSCTISGCVVTETEELPALGHQWSDWTPVKGDSSREYRICEVCNEVEYRDVSHNSDSSISTGLRVLDPAQTNIIQNVQLVQLSQINHTLYIHVAQETASLQGDLSDLTDLRSENIKTVVFSTVSCTSTLSLSDVAALGAGSTPFALSHSGSTSTFTVGGADHTALLR